MAYIIGFIVVILIISFLKELIAEYWPILLLVLGIILLFIFTGPVGGIFAILLIALIFFIREQCKKANERNLLKFLRQNCTQLGFVSSNDYDKIAPNFKDKSYKTSYFQIVSSFVKQNEIQYIDNNGHLIDPAVKYINKKVMADLLELMSLSYPGLAYTHCTCNEEIIVNRLAKKCGTNEKFTNIKLQEDKVKEELAGRNIPYSEYYLNAYKVNGSELLSSDNFESEEISLDDL